MSEPGPSTSRLKRKASIKTRGKVEKSEGHIWSRKEKKELLEAMRKHGFHNYEALSEVVGKSSEEIRYFVELRNHHARRLLGSTADTTPIELWMDRVNRIVGRAPDYSTALPEAFEMMRRHEYHDEDEMFQPNYPVIYDFLEKLLKGEPPPYLEAVESLVVLRILKILATILKSVSTEAKDFLLDGAKEDARKQGNTGFASHSKSQENGDAALMEDSQSLPSAPMDSSGLEDSFSLLETLSTNPLKLPANILADMDQQVASHPLYKSFLGSKN